MQPEEPEQPEQPEQPEENEPAEQPVQPEPALQALENGVAPQAVDVAGHTNHDNWIAINTANELTAITEAGNYYLTDNIELTKTYLQPANGVVLCLNGKSITEKGQLTVIAVPKNSTFTLCDCTTATEQGKITHEDAVGRGVYIMEGSTFTMYGGNITGNVVHAGDGGGVYVSDGSTFNMFGGSITGNAARKVTSTTGGNGGGVYVGGGSKFEMSGSASITDNTASGSNNGGGGVYVNSGTFEMSGSASITDNQAAAGGGVYVDNNGTFTMSNGSITGNKTDYGGGGVYVNGGRFEMSDSASITGNEVSGLYNGGGVYVNGGTFYMSGGSITGNKAIGTNSVGGGVYVESGTFTMSGGTIGGTGNDANTANLSGGGVYVYGGTFTMSGGTIGGTGNDANKAKNGGGVYVTNSGKFEMSGSASITGNKASSSGGGVYVNPRGTFEMSDGSITGNTACGSNSGDGGGGVYVNDNGTFKMSGGTITDNKATSDVNPGGGVFVSTDYFTVSGSVQITGNSRGSMKDNVYLYGSSMTMKIGDDGLDNAAEIGVTPWSAPESGKPVQIATGAKEGVDYTKIFQQDATDTTYEIYAKGDGVYLSTHQHKWTYALQENTTNVITATCKNCPEHSNSDYVGGTLTIKTPTSSTYDGSAKAVEVENTVAGLTAPHITYKQGDNELSGAPTNAGTYKASIKLGSATASVTYEITKATPTVDDFTFAPPTDLTYNGSAKEATVAAKNPGMGEIKVKYFKNDVETEPKDAGTYTVKIDVAGGTNYTAKTDLEVGKFTINKADYTGTPITIEKTVLWQSSCQTETVDMTGRLPVLDGVKMVTAQVGTDTDHIIEKVAIIANTVEIDLSSNVAYGKTATINVTITSTNYNDITATITVNTKDKDQATVTISGLPDTVTYGDTFTLTPTAKYGETTLSGGKWKWDYSRDCFKSLGSDENTGTITLQAIQAGTGSFEVDYFSDTHRGSCRDSIEIQKKALTQADLTGIPASLTKVYDGTNTYTGNAVYLTLKDTSLDPNIKIGVSADQITFAQSDAGQTTAKIDLTNSVLTPNYKFANGFTEITVPATITQATPDYTAPTGLTAIYGQTLADVALTGGWSWMNAAQSVGGASGTAKTFKAKFTPNDTANYKTLENIDVSVTVNKAPAPTLPDLNLSHKYTLTGPQMAQLPALDGAAYTLGAATGDTAILSAYSVQNDVLTYTLSGTGAAGDTVTLPVTITSPNYADTTFNVVITLTAKDVPAVTANDITLTYTGSAIPASAITGTADVKGAWSWKNAAPQNVADSGAHTVVFTPADTANYAPAEVNITVTITPAAATGAPKYTKITSGGKTLADAALTADGSTLSPAAGTLEWLDDAGSVLPVTTAVEANKTYTWRFTPAGGNHTVLTGAVELYHVASSGGRRTTPTVDVSKLPLLSTGSTGEYVKWLQQRLNALGYDCGSADGIFGSRTYAAVTAFQKANGLSADGIVGPLTWTRLDMGAILPANTTLDAALPLLRTGSTGEYVKRLQQRLNALGYDCGDADGIFGSRTHAAVIAFQKANGLSADGIAGPLTWAKLG